MNKYTGIFPALVTPYKSNGKINEESLQKIINLNLDKGVKGFYIGGSTAEAFLLSMDERKYILDIVAQECKGKCTLISHIGSIGTEHAVELGKYSEALGYDAISSVAPFYYKFSFEEIKNYYFDIVNNVNLPMIIYNFPAFSGVTFNMSNIKEFMNDERFIGIKHTSYDLYQLEQMLKIDERLTVFNGHDEVFLGALAMGAKSAIGSTFNFMSEKFIKIDKLFKEGNISEAQEVQAKANEIIDALIKVGVNQGVKYALEIQGIECNGSRRPFRSLTEDDKKLLEKILE
ncbi:N-acetylneuraminate lyase [Clostridium swellfunianum]|uniref:N-acetylneuraminate lyase n=1 Tax=Clostridium swellfunianum TaxID=1367462 RepID=UPI00202E5128|nr:N-acetylneuraminate lyase [Clostridium swellfunianum]MCM0649348.1 N-acetylneuraminate lyase [Clostridium swellfunianum]